MNTKVELNKVQQMNEEHPTKQEVEGYTTLRAMDKQVVTKSKHSTMTSTQS